MKGYFGSHKISSTPLKPFLDDHSSRTGRWLDPETYRLDGRGRLPGLERVIDATVIQGGKRLRPILIADLAALFGVTPSAIEPFARAAEQIHSATLAHDDVVDASSTRRGIDTLNARLENRRAVLGGDYLLAEGIYTVTRQKNAPLIETLAETLRELVTGEILQNEARGNTELNRGHLARIANLKTGSLFRWCCSVPAHLVGADAETLRLVGEFGTRLGSAFQLVDDVLDYASDTGKPFAQDLREGLLNAVSVELLDRRPESRTKVRALFEGRAEFALPWSEADLRDAQSAVRRRALEELASARAFLGDLVDRLARVGTPVDPAAVQRIERMLEALENRKR